MSFYKEVPGRQTTLESTLKFDTKPTEGSTNPVTSDGVAKSNTDILYVGDEMKGQDVLPILELEIEADAILDASTGLAI